MNNITAAQIMTRDVISVTPETSIEELASVLSKNRISGAPVVDEEGALVGIVTEKDLIRQNARLHIPTVIRIFDASIMLGKPGRMLDEMKRMAATRVEDILSREVVTISPEDTIQEIATIMSEKNVHLLPVLDEGKIVGIVGKVDMVRALSTTSEEN